MDAAPLRIDGADVRQTDDELTLILSAGGLHVMLIRLRYDGWGDEVINSAGVVTYGPAAWTLVAAKRPSNSTRGRLRRSGSRATAGCTYWMTRLGMAVAASSPGGG